MRLRPRKPSCLQWMWRFDAHAKHMFLSNGATWVTLCFARSGIWILQSSIGFRVLVWLNFGHHNNSAEFHSFFFGVCVCVHSVPWWGGNIINLAAASVLRLVSLRELFTTRRSSASLFRWCGRFHRLRPLAAWAKTRWAPYVAFWGVEDRKKTVAACVETMINGW